MGDVRVEEAANAVANVPQAISTIVSLVDQARIIAWLLRSKVA